MQWLVTNGVLPADVVTRNRQIADAAFGREAVFMHGDLRSRVFVGGDEITGVSLVEAGGAMPCTTSPA
jgi:hypothetical protein